MWTCKLAIFDMASYEWAKSTTKDRVRSKYFGTWDGFLFLFYLASKSDWHMSVNECGHVKWTPPGSGRHSGAVRNKKDGQVFPSVITSDLLKMYTLFQLDMFLSTT